MAKRRCPVCGSRKWRKDGISGSVVCEEGHVLQGVRSESNVQTEATPYALQKRRIKRGERVNKRKKYGRSDKELYHGEAAEQLRLQGLQLLLRYQVQALKEVWSVPDIYEVIVRDLWMYQLCISNLHPTSERRSRPEDAGPSKSQNAEAEGNEDDSGGEEGSQDGSETEKPSQPPSDNDESVVSDDPAADVDPEFVDLMSNDEDDDNDEEETPAGPGDASETTREPWKRSRPIRVSDTLVCIIVGLWLTRVPFTYATVETLVNTNQLPYIDFARTTLVPAEMLKHMNRHVRLSLRPQRSPSPKSLFNYTRMFARTLTVHFGVKIPEINLPPVAWHVLSQLGCTPDTYYKVLGFLELIDVNMCLTDTDFRPHARKRRNSDSDKTFLMTTHFLDVHPPELSLVSGWVIVMKMAYGLDGRPRLPLIATDPLIGMPKGEMWIAELEKRLKSGILEGPRRDLEQLNMDGEAIDRFLDRAEDVLLKNRDHGQGGSAFPLPHVEHLDPIVNDWSKFHAEAEIDSVEQAKPPPPSTPNKQLPLLPGEALLSFDASDPDVKLPYDMDVVVRAAAAVSGFRFTDVLSLVEQFERRMDAARPRRSYPEHLAARKLRRSVTGLRESRSFG